MNPKWRIDQAIRKCPFENGSKATPGPERGREAATRPISKKSPKIWLWNQAVSVGSRHKRILTLLRRNKEAGKGGEEAFG